MKKLLLLFGVCVWNCVAQSTFDFTVSLSGENVVPRSEAAVTGAGTLALVDHRLNYDLTTDYIPGWASFIYGPAEPGMNAPSLFGPLRGIICEAPLPGGHGGYCLYRGMFTVSDEQKTDLLNGLWYVQITSTAFPQLAMRGQVVLVPEPGTALLLLAGMCLVAVLSRKSSRRN